MTKVWKSPSNCRSKVEWALAYSSDSSYKHGDIWSHVNCRCYICNFYYSTVCNFTVSILVKFLEFLSSIIKILAMQKAKAAIMVNSLLKTNNGFHESKIQFSEKELLNIQDLTCQTYYHSTIVPYYLYAYITCVTYST